MTNCPPYGHGPDHVSHLKILEPRSYLWTVEARNFKFVMQIHLNEFYNVALLNPTVLSNGTNINWKTSQG